MAAPTVTLTPGVTARIEDEEYSWDEATATFDASSDPWSLTVSAANFPSLTGHRANRRAWIWTLWTKNTSATGTFTVFVDNADGRRLVTLDATSAANGHCSDAEYEHGPRAIPVALGDVLTIDKGEAGGAGAGTITIGIGPVGVL